MPEQQTAQYKKLVHEIAEEMARAHKGHLSSFDDPFHNTKHYWTQKYLFAARIAVRRMAESFYQGWVASLEDHEVELQRIAITNSMIERGLIF